MAGSETSPLHVSNELGNNYKRQGQGQKQARFMLVIIIRQGYCQKHMPILDSSYTFLTSGLSVLNLLVVFLGEIAWHEPYCRHALEAFAHKISKTECQYDSYLTRTANHNSRTSASYGRDQHAIINIPADITEANFDRCVSVGTMWQCQITLR